MWRRVWFGLFVVLVQKVVAQDVLSQEKSLYDSIPILDDPSQSLWSKDKERAIGREAFYSLYRDGRTVKDIGVNDYLTSLGATLSAPTESRVGYHFFVAKSDSINAFAGIGGTVGINSGLWIATENEHELSAVMAHEIAHVARQHVAQTIRGAEDRSVLNTALLVASALVATTVDSKAGMGLATISMGQAQQDVVNDIRAHEKEADRYGRQLMREAGFDTRAMQTFFAKLYTPKNASFIPEFVLTHPLPIYRQADAEKLNEAKRKVKHARSREDFWFARAWVMGETLSTDAFSHQLTIERQTDKVAPRKRASQLAEAIFALKQNDYDRAESALSSLKSSDNLFVLRARAKFAKQKGDMENAEKLYERMQKLYPNVLAVVYDYADFLQTNGQHRKAKSQLRPLLSRGDLPAEVYHLYANILSSMGDDASANRFLIDYYVETGQYDLAESQLALTKRQLATESDWRLGAILDEKAKQIARRKALLEK